jgi:hypothetical protein
MRQIKNKNNFQASVSNEIDGPSVNKLKTNIQKILQRAGKNLYFKF